LFSSFSHFLSYSRWAREKKKQSQIVSLKEKKTVTRFPPVFRLVFNFFWWKTFQTTTWCRNISKNRFLSDRCCQNRVFGHFEGKKISRPKNTKKTRFSPSDSRKSAFFEFVVVDLVCKTIFVAKSRVSGEKMKKICFFFFGFVTVFFFFKLILLCAVFWFLSTIKVFFCWNYFSCSVCNDFLEEIVYCFYFLDIFLTFLRLQRPHLAAKINWIRSKILSCLRLDRWVFDSWWDPAGREKLSLSPFLHF